MQPFAPRSGFVRSLNQGRATSTAPGNGCSPASLRIGGPGTSCAVAGGGSVIERTAPPVFVGPAAVDSFEPSFSSRVV